MVASPKPAERPLEPERRFVINDVTWAQYVMLREVFDDVPGLRMTFCEGELELMSPSLDHERAKTLIGRLVEHYAFARAVRMYGYGSATFRKEAKERGVEPDECYYFGRDHDAERRPFPDLAIEVVISKGMKKLPVYAGLRVPEVWIWTPDDHPVHVLRGSDYVRVDKSTFLPDLDLDLLARLAWYRDQVDALSEFHEAIGRTTKATTRSGRASGRKRR